MGKTFETVLGEVYTEESGYILPHEHILSLLEIPPLERYSEVIDEAHEHFVAIYKELAEKYNCKTVVECSTSYWMDMELAVRIARESGINLVLSTGWYSDQYALSKLDVCYRPPEFNDNPAEVIANVMIDELTVGMKGTDIKAGIIKIAVSDINSDSDLKLLKAAAITHKETGASITTHTVSIASRIGTLNCLEELGVDPKRIYLGHADGGNGSICESLLLVKRGCNLIFTIWGITNPDLIGWDDFPLPKNFSSHVMAALVDDGYADKMLFSIDYSVNYRDGGLKRSLYEIPERTSLYAFTHVVPQLKKLGVSQADIDKIMIENPRKMLAYR